MHLTLRGADGTLLSESRIRIEKPLARYFRFVGRKKPKGGWPKGAYQGAISITRDGVTVTKHASAAIQ